MDGAVAAPTLPRRGVEVFRVRRGMLRQRGAHALFRRVWDACASADEKAAVEQTRLARLMAGALLATRLASARSIDRASKHVCDGTGTGDDHAAGGRARAVIITATDGDARLRFTAVYTWNLAPPSTKQPSRASRPPLPNACPWPGPSPTIGRLWMTEAQARAAVFTRRAHRLTVYASSPTPT